MNRNINLLSDFQHKINDISTVYQQDKVGKILSLVSEKWLLIWTVIIINIVAVHSARAADLTVLVGSGSTFWSNASGNITGVHPNKTDADASGEWATIYWALRWNLVPEGSRNSSRCTSATSGFVDISGLGMIPQVGMKIADGIVLYFTNGDLKSSIVSTQPATSAGTATLSSNGTITGLTNSRMSDTQKLCATIPAGVAIPSGATVNTSLTNGKLAVYVDKTAKPGTYNIPSIYLVTDIKSSLSGLVASGGTLIVKDQLFCSVSTPPLINFGNVDISGRKDFDLLGVNNGELHVTCTGGVSTTTATATARIRGTTGRYTNTLKMDLSSGGESPAEIRGFIGQGINLAGACADQTNYPGWIQFDSGKNQSISIGKFNVGQNNIPYSFSLCATGKNGLGPAKAQATINIDWE